MGYLLELVFEQQTEATAARLLEDISLSSGDLQSADIDDNPVSPRIEPKELIRRIRHIGMFGFEYTTFTSTASMRGTMARVIRHKGLLDVELNMALDDAEDLSALEHGLHSFANKLATRHSVLVYYAGLDPAMDEDTRIFTGVHSGPHHLS